MIATANQIKPILQFYEEARTTKRMNSKTLMPCYKNSERKKSKYSYY